MNARRVETAGMHLTDDTMRSLRIAKVFRQNENRINSVSFTADGESVLCASDDDTITIYDCMNGIPKRILNSKKYGVDLIRCACDGWMNRCELDIGQAI